MANLARFACACLMMCGPEGEDAPAEDLAAELIGWCRQRGLTLGAAESLTGGWLVGQWVSIPGASDVVRGGIVAYSAQVKTEVLGVRPSVLAQHGTVSAACAQAMAAGARRVLGADIGIATTGVAGPDAVEGHAPGTVFVALEARLPSGEKLRFHYAATCCGMRSQVRQQTISLALSWALNTLMFPPPAARGRRVGVP